MTTASFAPCSICDLQVCPGPEGCPFVINEDVTVPTVIRPAIHLQNHALKIPNDISPILKRLSITTPKDGTIGLFWKENREKIKVTIQDNSKIKTEKTTVFYTGGNKSFPSRALSFKGGVLIKIQK